MNARRIEISRGDTGDLIIHPVPESRGAALLEALEGFDDDFARLLELQMKNFDLRVQLEGQKYLVGKYDDLVSGERERHEREKLALVDRLTDARHQIGSLEEKLLRLDAPKALVRDVETGNRDEVYRTAEPERREV